MRLSAIHDFLFDMLRRKHEKMLAKHTDKRKACPYDAYRISIFFAAVGFSCRTLLGGSKNPPNAAPFFAYVDISPNRGFPRPTGLCAILSFHIELLHLIAYKV